MQRKIIALSLALALLCAMLCGCAAPAATPTQEAVAPEAAPATEPAAAEPAVDPAAPEAAVEPAPADAAPRTFTDSAQRTVELPAQITKIAVSGPLAQISVFALAPEMLVGIATEWDKTAEAYLSTAYYNLPVLGQLYGGKGELNLEELLKAAPDVVIDVGEPKGTIAEDMDALQEQTGIPFVHITMHLNDMGDAYRKLGELLGKAEDAELLAMYCDEVYAKIAALGEKVEKASVLYITGAEGHSVIAKGSFHAEVLDMLVDNKAEVDEPSSKGTGNEVDMEQILLWDPEVILFAPDGYYASAASDPAFQKLQAVKSGRYYEVPFGPYCYMGFPPGAQRLLGMLWLAKLLYPEAADYDLQQEVTNYYKLFYGCDLSDEQYRALVANSIAVEEAQAAA